MRLCVCTSGEREGGCIDPNTENLFPTLRNIDCSLTKTAGLLQESKYDKPDPHSTTVTWKWTKIEKCELYYILTYNKEGNRIPEHEIIAAPDKTSHEFLKDLEIRVLALFKSNSITHGFVEVSEACYFIDHYKMVIDLTTVKNINRGTARLSETHFGFLCSVDPEYQECQRIASKKVNIKEANDEDHKRIKEVKKQIRLALAAGGQYNMKYLACTNIDENKDIWIAMEMCIRTLDVLITKKLGSEWLIDDNKMKICFRQILQGLIHLNSKGIQHGEMILENILLSLDGEVLKIGEYDHVKQIQLATLGEAARANDVEKTGEMFFKCLKRDSKCDLTPLTDLTSCDDTDDTNGTDGLPSCDKYWIKQLKKLANELGGDENSYLAAYLIIYIVLEKPTAEEVLNHPYFWNEYKMLSFVTRMDASFYKECGLSALTEIKSDFQSCFEILSDPSSTQNINWHDGVGKIPVGLCDKELKDEMNQTLVNSKGPKYNCRDITRFLRFIRNMHLHYHEDYTEYKEKRKEKFESTSHVWKCVNSMHPGMICLLHRVVWTKRGKVEMDGRPSLPDDLSRFFSKSKFVGTLGLGKENEMNYYDT